MGDYGTQMLNDGAYQQFIQQTANPALDFLPTNIYYKWSKGVHAFDEKACACLSADFCNSLDQAGNKNGVPENVDIPKDANVFKALVKGHKISPKKFLQCTEPPPEPKPKLTLEQRRIRNTALGAVSGAGVSFIVAMAMLSSPPIWAVVGLVMGVGALGGAISYFLTR